MNKFKRNILIALGVIFIVSFTLISFRPFTITCTIRVRIEKEDKAYLGTYDNNKIQKIQEDGKYYLFIPNTPVPQKLWQKPEKPQSVKLTCTEEQFNKMNDLQEHYYSLQFKTSVFHKSKGKLISIYESYK